LLAADQGDQRERCFPRAAPKDQPSGNEYLSKLSLPAISTLVAGRLHTADAGVLKFSFYLSAQSVRQAI